MNKPQKDYIDYSQKVLEVKNLKQYFKVGVGGKKMVVKAVDGVSFDVYKREVFGLVGESGCGKTTTGRTIIKIYNATDGIVKFNGKIVGVGLQGDLQRIRELRLNRKKEIIQHYPVKKQIYDLKEETEEKVNVLLDEIRKVQFFQKQKESKINSVFVEFNNQIDLANHRYDTKVNEAKRKEKEELDRLTERDLKALFRIYNKTLELIKDKTKDKIKYIKSIQATKEEKDQKIQDILETEVFNINVAVEKLIKSLNDIDPVITKEYEEQMRSHNKVKYMAKRNLKSVEVKEKIQNVQKHYDELLAQYKAYFDKEMAEITKNKPSKDEINKTLNAAKEEADAKINELKQQIKALKAETAEKIKKIKADAKANPVRFEVDKAEIEKIKEKYAELIKQAKSEYRDHKYYNKLKETPAEKAARLEKIKAAKAAYLERIKGKSPDEVAHEKALYQAEIEEIMKTKTNYANTMSKMQMVFQDPIASLNPRMIVKDIISEGLVIRGERNKAVIEEKVNKILDMVGLIPDHATRYPHEFSGGQRQRIGIARALIVDPDFIIADEPISALDVSIQAQILNLLNDLKKELGLTILFIAHDLSVVKYFCDRIAVMYYGKIVELASSEELFQNPLHPYTKSLLSAIPQPDPIYEAKRVRVGYDPSIHNYTVDKPKLVEIKPGHFIYANEAELKNYRAILGIEE